jgi:hypothetical protein
VAERFAISYGRAFEPLATLTGTGARYSGVELDEETLRVRMGWAFRAGVPRASIASVERGEDVRMTRGVHGWRGDWPLCRESLPCGGAARPISRRSRNTGGAGFRTAVTGRGSSSLASTPARASMSGVPIRLERLRVSLEDPDGFLAAIKGLSKTGR